MNMRGAPITTHLPTPGRVRRRWRSLEATPRGSKCGAHAARFPLRGPSTNRYGGNTSCLQLTLSDGRLLVLDVGSGIRNLRAQARRQGTPHRRHPAHARSTAQCSRAAVATRLRSGTRRLAPRPRLPVHGRRVPESHRLGTLPPWRVLAFARLTEAQRFLLFHHDPLNDDEQLDRLHAEALARWAAGTARTRS
jgi:hypothetical protein